MYGNPAISYKVICVEHLTALETRVNNMIEDGWIPAGGVYQHNNRYLQAMWRPPLPHDVREAMKKVMDK